MTGEKGQGLPGVGGWPPAGEKESLTEEEREWFETATKYVSKYGTNVDPEQIDAWAALDRIKSALIEARRKRELEGEQWKYALEKSDARVTQLTGTVVTLEQELQEAREELRLRESSQIPVIPRAAQAEIARLREIEKAARTLWWRYHDLQDHTRILDDCEDENCVAIRQALSTEDTET